MTDFIYPTKDCYCIWTSDPMHLAVMVSYHGEAKVVQRGEVFGVQVFYILFNDGLEVQIDGGLIKQFSDIDESLWFKKFDQSNLKFQRFQDIRSKNEGYYAYYTDVEQYLKNDMYRIFCKYVHGFSFLYTEYIGKANMFLGQIKSITTENEFYLISKDALYRLNHSNLRNINDDDSSLYPNQCTVEDYIDYIRGERFSLIYSYTEESIPSLIVEREVRYEIELIPVESFITRIEPYSFYKNMNITEIEIPGTVKSIGYCAFAFCGNLQNVIFKAIVNEIDGDIFTYSAVKHIIVPDGTIDAFHNLLPLYKNKIIETKDYYPLVFDSCIKDNAGDSETKNDNLPELFEVYDNNKIGFINHEGKVIIPALYHAVVGDFYFDFNKIAACGDDGWVLLDSKGHITPLTQKGIIGKPIKIMRNRYLILTKGWNQHAIYDVDINYMVVDYGVYDYIWYYNPYWDTLKVKRGSKWGIIMMNGAVILRPIYDRVIVTENYYTYIDENGNTIKCDFKDHKLLKPKFIPDYRADEDYWRDSWDAMTDGMYGDYNGGDDFEFMGE